MLKTFFIKQGIKEAQIDEFIRKEFPLGDYSRTELQRTPLGTKIIIYTNKPGRIIGRGGKNINDITDAIKLRFDLENPQLDVRGIRQPDLDAKIVAKQIASAIEKGYNYKKIGNLTLNRIMHAGAAGAEIVIAGKLTGGKGMRSKFIEGYLKHCGQPAKDLIDFGFEEAKTKPGKIGVTVRIMRDFVDISGQVAKKQEEKLKETKEKRAKEAEEELEQKEKKLKESKTKTKPKEEKKEKKIKVKERKVEKKVDKSKSATKAESKKETKK
ncbi:MAG: 30S ribosomal protein S3 [Candidatus Aenigmatarchaeota archaeon]